MTICTRDRNSYLGRIVDGAMRLSMAGEILAAEWRRTEQVRQYVRLDQWGIMPNHFHGIVILSQRKGWETSHRLVSTTAAAGGAPTALTGRSVPTTRAARPLEGATARPGTLGSIVGQFKSVCTKRIWETGHTGFAWQPGFFDHIIRNQESLEKIREYICGNPAKWEADRYYTTNG